jgi:crossover junction endodeoxyribonuclease RuvC
VIIIGIDPGFAFVGVGVIELLPTSTRVIHHETFASRSKDEDTCRLDGIAEHLLDLLEQHEPDALGYENQAWVDHAVRKGDLKHDGEEVKVNASSRRVHEVSGIIRCAARCFDIPVYCLASSTMKVAILGKGGSRQRGKQPVKDRVRMLFGVKCSEHAADAIAIAIGTGVRHRRHVATLAAHAELIH